MVSWDKFLEFSEKCQSQFLIKIAEDACNLVSTHPNIKERLRYNIAIAKEIIDGNYTRINELMLFLNDPEMLVDFSSYYEIVKNDSKFAACLDIASYACGFVCRVYASQADIKSLSDPILESLPEIYEYYEDKYKYLGL